MAKIVLRNFLANQNTGIPYIKLILITIPGRAICKPFYNEQGFQLVSNIEQTQKLPFKSGVN